MLKKELYQKVSGIYKETRLIISSRVSAFIEIYITVLFLLYYQYYGKHSHQLFHNLLSCWSVLLQGNTDNEKCNFQKHFSSIISHWIGLQAHKYPGFEFLSSYLGFKVYMRNSTSCVAVQEYLFLSFLKWLSYSYGTVEDENSLVSGCVDACCIYSSVGSDLMERLNGRRVTKHFILYITMFRDF